MNLRLLRPSGPEAFLVAAVLGFGAVWAIAIPLGAGNDEETHLVRIWEMSALSFVPNEGTEAYLRFPALYWDLSYRRQALVRPVPADFLQKNWELPIGAKGPVPYDIPTRSGYSPILLLPQSLAMRFLGRAQQMPALPVFYLVRLVGLLCYLGLAWVAVRLAPYGKWMIAVLAALPMAIFQAATLNADAIANGIGLLFISAVLAVSSQQTVRRRHWWMLVLLTALLFGAKPNLAPLALLLPLLLRPSHFAMKYGWVALTGVIVLLAAVEMGGWNALVLGRYGASLPGASTQGQLAYIANQPLAFAGTVVLDVASSGMSYLKGFIGEYGNGYWTPPAVVFILSPAALLGALALDASKARVRRRDRVALGVVFGLCYVATVAALYVAYTPVGSSTVEGVNGRYLLPFAPAILLAVAPSIRKAPSWLTRRLVVVLAIAGLAAFSAGMYLSYYYVCGTKAYSPGLCYQPIYKNWAPNEVFSPPLSAVALTQEIIPECNGITELRVWMDRGSADPEGTTSILFRDPTTDRNLVDQTIANTDLPEQGWYTMRFEPEWHSAGSLYLLKMGAEDQGGVQGVRAAYTIQPEYLLGKLLEGQTESSVDLVFQYGCLTGLQKLMTAR